MRIEGSLKKALLFARAPYNTDIVFDPNSRYNSDGLLDSIILTKRKFLDHGIDLVAGDNLKEGNFEFYLFTEIPKNSIDLVNQSKSYLMLMETELIIPWNWNTESHKKFKKIFTWNDELIDNKRYYKYNNGRSGTTDWVSFKERKKLCTLISGNKDVRHPLELYSLRKDFIEYFEDGKQQYFDFFGQGWDRYIFTGPKIVRALNRVLFLQRLLAPKYKTYKGTVARKVDTLKYYKFSICFENGRDLPDGHISEKIFDSLAAGCVPIYYGAHNITDYVPENCFVDYRKFKSKDELFQFINEISEDKFTDYLLNIKTFMASTAYEKFTPEFNSNVLVNEILKDISDL